MSITSKYKTLSIYEYSEGNFSTADSFTLKSTFQGLIQNAAPSNTFNNAKDTSSVSAVLFCGINEVFESTDIIQNVNGARYKIANSDLQYNGVTGIRGHHSEYNLTYFQE